MNDSVNAPGAPEPIGAYPHARLAGGFLFLSGLGPRIPGSNDVPGNVHDAAGKLIEYDIEAQTRQLVCNLKQVLAASGAGLSDLIDITVYLTDMHRDFTSFNRVYAEYFGTIRPCRTTVEVRALPTPIAVEFKCIAWVGGREQPRPD